MESLRAKQGITNDENSSNSFINRNDFHHDIFDPCPNDITETGDYISAYKLMISIMNSEFKVAQQMEEHLVDCIPKATYKFPRTCALLCAFEIIGNIASNVLKYRLSEVSFTRKLHIWSSLLHPDFTNKILVHLLLESQKDSKNLKNPKNFKKF